MFQSLPLGDQIQYFAGIGLPTDLLEPRVLGAVQTITGVLLAVPLNPALNKQVQDALDLFVTDNRELLAFPATKEVTLPTPGVAVDGRVGACNCCEDHVAERQQRELARMDAETALLEQQAAQAAQEAWRYKLRLDSKPPNLDDPDPSPSSIPIEVRISQDGK